ncbi:MAG: hypothetical protein HGA35_00720 [Erysipelotrichaceae bacterium]|jgi:hypothetical protein|nr:hypothetical protein [Erysipelotrichaceae bacterium]
MNRAMIQSYLRTAISAAVAVWMTGNHDWKALGTAALSAVLGPLMRALNPNDHAFGIKNPNSQS